MRVCPNCQAIVSETANFCDNCGRPFRSSPVVPRPAPPPGSAAAIPGTAARPPGEVGLCSACGYRNMPGEMFCQNCGVQLAPVASTPPPPPLPLGGNQLASSAGVCPECGAVVSPQDGFCLNCGVQLVRLTGSAVNTPADGVPGAGSAAAIAPPPPARSVPETPPRPVMPELALVVRESGVRLAAPRQAEIIIGRSDPVRGIFPDVDVTLAGGDTHGVSRKHARLFYYDGLYYLEDLNSTNFTFLNRQRLQPGQHHPVQDGDEIRIGLLALQIAIH